MVPATAVLTFLICVVALSAQTQPAAKPSAAAEPEGMMTPWEIAPVLKEIAAHGGRLAAELGKLDVKAWVNQGASETYLAQWQSSQQQAKAVQDTAAALAGNPEKLSAGLELLFRIRALDDMVGSLEEGARRYQNAGAAQRLASLDGEIDPDRQRFERYVVGLAEGQEQELAVMNKEAQRCRGMMTTPAVSPRTGKKK
jgi:hypothetical protein